jgi:hypothetical protein
MEEPNDSYEDAMAEEHIKREILPGYNRSLERKQKRNYRTLNDESE